MIYDIWFSGGISLTERAAQWSQSQNKFSKAQDLGVVSSILVGNKISIATSGRHFGSQLLKCVHRFDTVNIRYLFQISSHMVCFALHNTHTQKKRISEGHVFIWREKMAGALTASVFIPDYNQWIHLGFNWNHVLRSDETEVEPFSN